MSSEYFDVRKEDSKARKVFGLILAILIIALIIGCIFLAIDIRKQRESKQAGNINEATQTTVPSTQRTVPSTKGRVPTTPDPTLGTWFNSYAGEYKTAAVASETGECSTVGIGILKKNGSAVDAAIATLLCVGATNLHSCGIGGGYFMTYYHRPTKSATSQMSREQAPLWASQDMYVNDTKELSKNGGKAIAVPTEILGYWNAWSKYGKLPWKDLFEPTIKLCEDGFKVSWSLAYAANTSYTRIQPNLREFLKKENGELYKAGDTMKRPVFAETLKTIAKEGGMTFYNGTLARMIVDDIKDAGGNITEEDLLTVTAPWKQPVSVKLNGGLTSYGPPPPSSAVVVNFMLSILDNYKFSSENIKDRASTVLSYHRLAEAMKFGFGKRSSLGDEDYVNVTQLKANLARPEFAEAFFKKIMDNQTQPLDAYEPDYLINVDGGTTQLSILDSEGSAVSMTSTINLYFGSGVMGNRTGIVFNNEMDDFSTPGTVNFFGIAASASNYITPGKRPMSSMSPLIVVDENDDVVLAVGSSGGTRIITTILQGVVRNLWFGESLKDAIDTPRIHHQLLPNMIRHENATEKYLVDGLKKLGHKMELVSYEIGTIQAVRVVCKPCENCGDCIQAISDGRKGGKPDGY